MMPAAPDAQNAAINVRLEGCRGETSTPQPHRTRGSRRSRHSSATADEPIREIPIGHRGDQGGQGAHRKGCPSHCATDRIRRGADTMAPINAAAERRPARDPPSERMAAAPLTGRSSSMMDVTHTRAASSVASVDSDG